MFSSIDFHFQISEIRGPSMRNFELKSFDAENCVLYLLLPLYMNWSITKYFPIETFLKIIDSSVKNPGEVEYDNENCVRYQKILVRPKNSK